MSSLVGGTVQRKNHGEIKEEGSFNPCLSKKSTTPPLPPPYGSHTITYIPKEFRGKSHKVNDRERRGGRRYSRGKWFFWIVKINKHVWAYSLQYETPQWESFLAEFQQQMKDNPTLNTCVGTYHLSFPIMGGQSCYDLIAEVELPLSSFLEKSYTNALSICRMHSWQL